MSRKPKWPSKLWVVRHAESIGNNATETANTTKSLVVNLSTRDVDVPLSKLGEKQALALGKWFGERPLKERPNIVLASPYIRAIETAKIALEAAGIVNEKMHFVIDERLREIELGIMAQLTKAGIKEKYPEHARIRNEIGQFYHRPPGGESWCDVILRLRSIVDTVINNYYDDRVLIVCHSIIVLCLRYILVEMTEGEMLAVDRSQDIKNCSITYYEPSTGEGSHNGLILRLSNFVIPIEE